MWGVRFDKFNSAQYLQYHNHRSIYLFIIHRVNLTRLTIAFEKFLRHVLTTGQDIDAEQSEVLRLADCVKLRHHKFIGPINWHYALPKFFVERYGWWQYRSSGTERLDHGRLTLQYWKSLLKWKGYGNAHCQSNQWPEQCHDRGVLRVLKYIIGCYCSRDSSRLVKGAGVLRKMLWILNTSPLGATRVTSDFRSFFDLRTPKPSTARRETTTCAGMGA